MVVKVAVVMLVMLFLYCNNISSTFIMTVALHLYLCLPPNQHFMLPFVIIALSLCILLSLSLCLSVSTSFFYLPSLSVSLSLFLSVSLSTPTGQDKRLPTQGKRRFFLACSWRDAGSLLINNQKLIIKCVIDLLYILGVLT